MFISSETNLFIPFQFILPPATAQLWAGGILEMSYKSFPLMKDLELATFAGGCFWCTEAIFAKNPDKLYCKLVISPKLTKLQEKFSKFVK